MADRTPPSDQLEVIERLLARAKVEKDWHPIAPLKATADVSDVNWPRVLLGIWLVLTIGWLGLVGFDLFMRWPEYYVFYKRPDGLLIDGMARVDLTESLVFALVPPIALLLIVLLVLWAV